MGGFPTLTRVEKGYRAGGFVNAGQGIQVDPEGLPLIF